MSNKNPGPHSTLWIADFIAVILLADTYIIKALRDFVNMKPHKKTAAGKKKRIAARQ